MISQPLVEVGSFAMEEDPELEELPMVMREIAEAMNGLTVALTLHPDHDSPELIYVDETAGITRTGFEKLLASGKLWPRQDNMASHMWLKHPFGAGMGDALSVPVQRVAGHSRLLVTIFFDELDHKQRAKALGVYTNRRPFAIGYFRLWQANRANMRCIRANEAALNFMELGVILLSSAGKVVFANNSAQSILDDGSCLAEHNQQIRAATLTQTVRLQAAINQVVLASKQPQVRARIPFLALERDRKPQLIVSMLPTPSAPEEPNDVAAMVFVVDPTLGLDELLKPICKAFQLSNAEAAIATLLATGSTLAEAAISVHVKEATARSYLKQIFVKTGTNRQAELVRVLLSSIVHIKRGMLFEVV